ncbi:hypothetical protein A249_39270 [Pseudomonas syringae pv. actinidiae ICMP 18804]|uniref:Uncharacterized protein n=2 Tax=Pseudomonas syringae pv. actinidiae TaxID=103796 RepID=A0A656JIU0_PSESF|nr:hypothetical protein A246_08593 [Pseudomonas syringae pv. actinidiae ICMP 19098]EPM69235.1 hypothetical protein A249_39270 [Pseudomonas syringae pv. actinidiae ICMP 18804]EPN19331.1 hypothetical protein A248_10315 [Pseudomonas syringae pv. actinidiae ICMP 19100]EPN22483.1 hypothetical protein A247_28171 [Pseudomonas syringae pv. actinidiae ICMP 19099]EPN29021.1 hypothetical protein A245_47148 [Pseudomonas syringae pv. actinidiae ICMP 19096]EPN35576.1 hypothetical protein A243_08918 [Pseudom
MYFFTGIFSRFRVRKYLLKIPVDDLPKLQVTTPGDGEKVYMGLRQALTDDTSDDSDFSSGYSTTLLHLRMQSRQTCR